MRSPITETATCSAGSPGQSSASTFFGLVFLLSSPFYISNVIAFSKGKGQELGPLFITLFTIAPTLSIFVLDFLRNDHEYETIGEGCEEYHGPKELFMRSFDWSGIQNAKWYMYGFIFLLPPLLFAVSYILCRLLLVSPGKSIPPPMAPIIALPAAFPLFVVMATFEEVGWMAYAYPRMQGRNAVVNAAILGLIWALWHVPFLVYLMPERFISQFFTTAATRIIIVWVYHHTNDSVLSSILYHAVDNAALTVFPDTQGGIPYGGSVHALVVVLATLPFAVHLYQENT